LTLDVRRRWSGDLYSTRQHPCLSAGSFTESVLAAAALNYCLNLRGNYSAEFKDIKCFRPMWCSHRPTPRKKAFSVLKMLQIA